MGINYYLDCKFKLFCQRPEAGSPDRTTRCPVNGAELCVCKFDQARVTANARRGGRFELIQGGGGLPARHGNVS